MRNLVIAALATALIASGCGTGRLEIDHLKAEQLARQIGSAKRPVESASCPSGVKAKKGANFDCDLVFRDGTKGKITIHQLDDKGRIRTSVTDVH